MNDKQLDLFYRNTLKMAEAIQNVGGCARGVLDKAANFDFMVLLARNGIEISTQIHKGIG